MNEKELSFDELVYELRLIDKMFKDSIIDDYDNEDITSIENDHSRFYRELLSRVIEQRFY